MLATLQPAWADTYDANTHILTIPLVTVGTDIYTGVVVRLDSFAVLSATGPNKPVFANEFIAGTYSDNQSVTCTLGTSILNDGRVESALSCNDTSKRPLSMAWDTGPIAGHPMEVDLRKAGIDKIAGSENYAWGKVGQDSINTWGNCFGNLPIISARQAGNVLSLYAYGADNIVDCGVNLVKK